MWAILVTIIPVTPYLNPAIPPPIKVVVSARFDTLKECHSEEKYYGGHNLVASKNFVTFHYDRKTQCIYLDK